MYYVTRHVLHQSRSFVILDNIEYHHYYQQKLFEKDLNFNMWICVVCQYNFSTYTEYFYGVSPPWDTRWKCRLSLQTCNLINAMQINAKTWFEAIMKYITKAYRNDFLSCDYIRSHAVCLHFVIKYLWNSTATWKRTWIS